MEDVQLVHALQTRQDGAMEQFQTAYTPLLRYIIAPILPDHLAHPSGPKRRPQPPQGE